MPPATAGASGATSTSRASREGFAQHLGVKHAISTSSCTGAMHMGLAALGVGPGDEVILGDINWIASAAPMTYVGARPYSSTSCPTLVPRPGQGRSRDHASDQGDRRVHLYGNVCALDALAARREARPRADRGRRRGTGLALATIARPGRSATFGTFSFHGTKTMTTGEGGMFVTSDAALYEKVLTLSNHGRVPVSRASSGPMWSASSTRCPICKRRSAVRNWSASTN